MLLKREKNMYHVNTTGLNRACTMYTLVQYICTLYIQYVNKKLQFILNAHSTIVGCFSLVVSISNSY